MEMEDLTPTVPTVLIGTWDPRNTTASAAGANYAFCASELEISDDLEELVRAVDEAAGVPKESATGQDA